MLIRYLTEHPTPHIRLAALRNLTAMEVVDDAEIIFHQLKNETHRHVQFLFAYRLYKIDDPRSFPLLAVFSTIRIIDWLKWLLILPAARNFQDLKIYFF